MLTTWPSFVRSVNHPVFHSFVFWAFWASLPLFKVNPCCFLSLSSVSKVADGLLKVQTAKKLTTCNTSSIVTQLYILVSSLHKTKLASTPCWQYSVSYFFGSCTKCRQVSASLSSMTVVLTSFCVKSQIIVLYISNICVKYQICVWNFIFGQATASPSSMTAALLSVQMDIALTDIRGLGFRVAGPPSGESPFHKVFIGNKLRVFEQGNSITFTF